MLRIYRFIGPRRALDLIVDLKGKMLKGLCLNSTILDNPRIQKSTGTFSLKRRQIIICLRLKASKQCETVISNCYKEVFADAVTKEDSKICCRIFTLCVLYV